MSIAAICQHEVITVDAGASLRDAAALMRARHVGALVVTVDSAGQQQAVGIITDRDLAIEILARDLDPADVKVGQLASRHLAAVAGSAGIDEAVAVMRQAGVRRLLVTEQNGQIAGFLSADDLLEAMAAQLGGLAAALRLGIARESTERVAAPPSRPRPVFLPVGTPGMQQPMTGR